MLIGVVLNMMLYGVVFIQMFTYYQRYPNDIAWIRYFMLYLFIVETVNVFVEFGIVYEPLILNYGQQVGAIPKLLPGDSILIAIVSAPIQLFTAWRISVITGSFILPGLIALLSLGSFGAGITVSTLVSMNPHFRDFGNFTVEVIVWLVLSAVCDIVIAIGMTHALYTRKTGLSDVDGKINRIIRLTVETGSLTAVAALADVMFFLVFPNTAANFIVDFPLSALYTCSLLAMLNSRDPRKHSDAERGTAPQTTYTQSQNTLKPPPSFQNSFHNSKMVRSQTKFESHTSTEKSMGTDNSDAASETTLAPHYYNYNRQELDVQGPKPTRLQLELPPKPFAQGRPLPHRF